MAKLIHNISVLMECNCKLRIGQNVNCQLRGDAFLLAVSLDLRSTKYRDSRETAEILASFADPLLMFKAALSPYLETL